MRPDLAPKTIGRVLDGAFELYRANFRVTAGASAALLLPFALLSGIAQAFYTRGAMVFFGDAFRSAASQAQSLGDPAGFVELQLWSLLTNASVAPFWLARIYLSACLFTVAAGLLYRQSFTVRDVLKAGARRFLWLLLVTVVLQAITSMGTLLFIAPGIVLGAGFGLAPAIVVIERASFADAFTRSWLLTTGHKWRVIGFFLVLSAFALVLQTAVNAPMLVRQLVESVQNPDAVFQPLSAGWKVTEGLFTALAVSLVYPFTELAWFCFYLDLRARREGMDLAARAAAIAKKRR